MANDNEALVDVARQILGALERIAEAHEKRATERPEDTLLDLEGVAKLLGISLSAVRERYRTGLLPKRIPASTPKRPLWRKADLLGSNP